MGVSAISVLLILSACEGRQSEIAISTTTSSPSSTTSTLPTPTVPESSTTGPATAAQPEPSIPEGWVEYDPGDGYTIALPPTWVDVTAVIKGEMDPSDIPGFENAMGNEEVSVEEIQQAFGSDLEHLSFFALDFESVSGINIVQRPNSTKLSVQEAQTELESRPDVPNSSVITVAGIDAVRFDFTIREYARVELALIEPDTLTFVSFSGPDGANDLQRILKTMNFS